MDNHALLSHSLIFLVAAVVAVSLFARLGLATVLGYLAAGSAIGPWGLHFIGNGEEVMPLAELGVVMLLFLIGLELKPSRLWLMRKPVIGMGATQVGVTGTLFALMSWAAGMAPIAAAVVGFALSLSSTAFALQILAERQEVLTQYGRNSFAILLFQDIAAIPMLALIPLASTQSLTHEGPFWFRFLLVTGAIIGLVVGGKIVLRPVFKIIALSKAREIFTAAALLLVLGVAYIMESIGISMALGAFSAGILLSDSEFRHELEADIEPFKGLLLGLFFISVGISIDYGILLREPLQILAVVLAFMATKATVIYLIARFQNMPHEDALPMAMLLPQGGEFAFAVLASALSFGILKRDMAGFLTVTVAVSMALTPMTVGLASLILKRSKWLYNKPYDAIDEESPEIIIAGFGRVGQMPGRILRTLGIPFTALEQDFNQVEVLRRFGHKVYYGDASRIDLLTAAGANQARILILAIDDVESSVRTAEVVRKYFPHLKIIARARNRPHAFQMLDLGIDSIHRETFPASLEMACEALIELGHPQEKARETVQKFRDHDEHMLIEALEFYTDEKRLIQYSKQSAKQLSDVLGADWVDKG